MRKIFSFFVAVMAVSSLSAKSIYLQVNDDWKSYGAVFFVHSWGGAADADVKLALVEGEEYLFSAEIPNDNNNLLFVRAQGDSEDIPWGTGNLWTQTGNLEIPDGKEGRDRAGKCFWKVRRGSCPNQLCGFNGEHPGSHEKIERVCYRVKEWE